MSLDAHITRIEERLDALEIKPSSPAALRALIERLDAKIREAQEKGYGIAEIVEVIVGCGLEADPAELKKHLTSVLESKRKKPAVKRGRTRAKKTPPHASS